MQPTFRDLIAANKRNSLLLVLGFCLFVPLVAILLSLGLLAYLSPSSLRHVNVVQALAVGGVAAGIALLLSLFAYFGGESMVLTLSHARPIAHKDDPELFNVVEEMAIAAGIPVPSIYVIDDTAPNAFATGRDPKHAAVTITTGLRTKLTRDELQGVIAHELSHIRNYDIRLMLLLTVLIGTVVMLADFFWQVLNFSTPGSGRRSRDSDKDGGGPLALVLLILAVILAIVAPLLAQLIQLAVRRQREYLADASGVELTRNPLGLASALRKIDADPDVLKVANRGTAHLYIANPIKKFEARAHTAFASHPPIKERIRRLEALAHETHVDR
ncbi:MAG TPA: M48 family metallopeptidase [Gemmataceae bacterium]|nr:M48 family metallopeptidase [Gemmataceae bacterium]